MTETTTQVERVALAIGQCIISKSNEPDGRSDIITADDVRDLATAAIKAMSDAEPVAWKCQERTMGAWHTRYVDERPTGERYRNIVPLYAHPPAAEPVGLREADVMIGNFIAQYDEGAAGCMMDADDAQALAHEFKRMQRLIYCPGVLRCAKCDFRLIKTTLTPAGAFANEEPDRCPNCDVPMWLLTWKDEAHDAYKTAESQMDRALEAERKLTHQPAAEPVGLREAVEGIDDDYMTSEKHHPGYVLIPTAKFEQIVSAAERAKEIVPPYYVNWHAAADKALATPARTDDAGEVDPELLDRAELAWQRYFYPASDNFAGPIGDKLPSVDLEVADCLRLVLAAMGRHVVTPSKDIPAVKPSRDAQVKTVAEKLAAFTGAPYEDWRHFTAEAGHIIDRLSVLATPARTDDAEQMAAALSPPLS